MSGWPMALDAYIKQDRQWPQHLRIAHAEYMLKQCDEEDNAAQFWRAVINRNRV